MIAISVPNDLNNYQSSIFNLLIYSSLIYCFAVLVKSHLPAGWQGFSGANSLHSFPLLLSFVQSFHNFAT